MGLICHDHDVPAFRQRLAGFLELLHGGENDVVYLTACQQFLQILAAFRLLGRLTQKILAPGELAIQLVVQVVAVGDNHNGGALQRLLQIMGIEHHGQRLTAALGVPEHAALAVSDGGVFGGFDGLFHREILVIACQNLKGVGTVHVEADKVLENIQEPLLLENSLKEGIELGGLCVLVAAVLGFPGHEAVLA